MKKEETNSKGTGKIEPDGVNGRYYFIRPENGPNEILTQADLCVQDIQEGTATQDDKDYPAIVVNHNGFPYHIGQLMEYYLSKQSPANFSYEEVTQFCDAIRRLTSWHEIAYSMDCWIEKQVKKHFLIRGTIENIHSIADYEPALRFSCYVAVCHTVYGSSYECVSTEKILGWVSQLKPEMVKELKKNGTGKLPKELIQRKTEHLTATANDAFATIRITAKDTSQESYAEALEYLCDLLAEDDFPRSYAIEFRSPEKTYLPIPGLPKKGINQLFAGAVQHPGLRPVIERYARLAMREDEWYNNLDAEQSAMTGTFAVFALALQGGEWWQLTCDYLSLCDDEHSMIQEKFIYAFIQKYGFTNQSMPVFIKGIMSMQEMKPHKDFSTLMQNPDSLDALLTAKEKLLEEVTHEIEKDKNASITPYELRDLVWENVCYTIWGITNDKQRMKVIKNASEELKERYQQLGFLS